MWDVALLYLDPLAKVDATLCRMLHSVLPNRLGQAHKQLVGHPAQPVDNLESLASILVEISQGARPVRSIKFQDRASGLSNESPASYISDDFAVREVQNDFVDAPIVGRRLIEPHPMWKLA